MILRAAEIRRMRVGWLTAFRIGERWPNSTRSMTTLPQGRRGLLAVLEVADHAIIAGIGFKPFLDFLFLYTLCLYRDAGFEPFIGNASKGRLPKRGLRLRDLPFDPLGLTSRRGVEPGLEFDLR